MNQNIEQLEQRALKIKNDLNALKGNVHLSLDKKKEKAKELKGQSDKIKQEVELKIKELESKEDNNSKTEKEKADNLLSTFEESNRLYSEVMKDISSDGEQSKEKTGTVETSNTTATITSTEKSENPEEEKGFFGKIGEGLGSMWSDVTSGDKRKEQPGKNLLYVAGVGLTGYAAYKGVKALWNWAFGKKKNDKEEGDEEETETKSKKKKDDGESFWDGTIGKTIKTVGSVLAVGSVGYYVAHGLYTKNRGLNDLWDREKGKKLEFDVALDYCKGAITNQDNKEGMSYGLDLKYNESTSEIEAYGEKIKIDKEKRKIEGLDVEFKKYEHMINAAILIAYLKKNYSGQCKNNSPFHLTGDWQGDINVNASNGNEEAVDGTGNGGRIVGVTAGGIAGIVTGIFGGLKTGAAVGITGGIVGYMAGSAYDHNNIMNDHMPELDNEYGKKSLQSYLNRMACWQAKNQTENDITESPIKSEIVEVMNTIQDTNKDLEPRGARRKIDAIPDPNDEKKYTIKAYGRDFSAEVTGDKGNRKIRILGISGGNPNIKTNMEKSGISNLELPMKEGLYMSCLVGFLLDNYHHKGKKYPRFYFGSRGLGIKSGLYFNDAKWYEIDNIDEYAVTASKFKERLPTLLQEGNGKKFLDFLNDGIMDGNTNLSVWKKMD